MMEFIINIIYTIPVAIFIEASFILAIIIINRDVILKQKEKNKTKTKDKINLPKGGQRF